MFSKGNMPKSMGTVILSPKSASSPISSFHPSASLGIFPNASSSFPGSSKLPNPLRSPFVKSPQMFAPPKEDPHVLTSNSKWNRQRLVFAKVVLSPNIFLWSPEPRTTNSCNPLLRCKTLGRKNIWLWTRWVRIPSLFIACGLSQVFSFVET